eukprot:Hpha_TRINITY_DN34024_c0_g1::TRINITY_DN34024_c0_g1_i1::g.30523::m.30523
MEGVTLTVSPLRGPAESPESLVSRSPETLPRRRLSIDPDLQSNKVQKAERDLVKHRVKLVGFAGCSPRQIRQIRRSPSPAEVERPRPVTAVGDERPDTLWTARRQREQDPWLDGFAQKAVSLSLVHPRTTAKRITDVFAPPLAEKAKKPRSDTPLLRQRHRLRSARSGALVWHLRAQHYGGFDHNPFAPDEIQKEADESYRPRTPSPPRERCLPPAARSAERRGRGVGTPKSSKSPKSPTSPRRGSLWKTPTITTPAHATSPKGDSNTPPAETARTGFSARAFRPASFAITAISALNISADDKGDADDCPPSPTTLQMARTWLPEVQSESEGKGKFRKLATVAKRMVGAKRALALFPRCPPSAELLQKRDACDKRVTACLARQSPTPTQVLDAIDTAAVPPRTEEEPGFGQFAPAAATVETHTEVVNPG